MFKKLMVIGIMVVLAGICYGATWERTYPELGISMARSICQTRDKGYAFTGITWLQSPGDLYIAKTDSLGNLLWHIILHRSDLTCGESIKQTPDSGLIILAYDSSEPNCPHFWLIKTNAQGDTLWTKNYGAKDTPYDLDICLDSGYVMSGGRGIPGNNYAAYVIKTDKDGNLVWETTLNTGYCGEGRSIKALENGCIVLTDNFHLVKLDNNGNIIWEKIYETEGWFHGFCMGLTIDGGYILCGIKAINHLAAIEVIKTRENGEIEWKKFYTENLSLSGRIIWQSEGGYMLVGTRDLDTSVANQYETLLFRLNENGDTLWTKTFQGPDHNCSPYSAVPTLDQGSIMAGCTIPPDGFVRTYLIKTDSQGNVGIEERPDNNRLSLAVRVYPNPSWGIVWFETENKKEIEITVFDILGRKIAVGKTKNGNLRLDLSPGIYFWRTNKNQAGEKIIVIRAESQNRPQLTR